MHLHKFSAAIIELKNLHSKADQAHCDFTDNFESVI